MGSRAGSWVSGCGGARCGVRGAGRRAVCGVRWVRGARCGVRGSGRWRWLGAGLWRGTGRASSHGSGDPARCAGATNPAPHDEPCAVRFRGRVLGARTEPHGAGFVGRGGGGGSVRGCGGARGGQVRTGRAIRHGAVPLLCGRSSHRERERARSLRHCTVRWRDKPAPHDEPPPCDGRCRVSWSRPAGDRRAGRRGRPGSRRGGRRRRPSGTTGRRARRRRRRAHRRRRPGSRRRGSGRRRG